MSCDQFKDGMCWSSKRWDSHVPMRANWVLCIGCKYNTDPGWPKRPENPVQITVRKRPVKLKTQREPAVKDLHNIINTSPDGDEQLIGDRLAKWIEKHGPDAAFKIVGAKRGFPCAGCSKRKEWLNSVHRIALGLLGGGERVVARG